MLQELLATQTFDLLLVFTRLGAAVMFLPVFSATMVPSRARLLLALALSLVVQPVLAGQLPAMPPAVPDLLLLLLSEVTIGVFLGVMVQFAMASLELAGSFMGYASGLTNAYVFDPATAQQNALITGFLNTAALAMIMITNTHHLMLRALIDSYRLFTPGVAPSLADFMATMVQTLDHGFLIGLELSMPLVAFNLVFNTAMGLISRMVPQMQIFFVGMPLQIVLGLIILMTALPVILMLFLTSMRDSLGSMIGG